MDFFSTIFFFKKKKLTGMPIQKTPNTIVKKTQERFATHNNALPVHISTDDSVMFLLLTLCVFVFFR
jgi:hypothetical protein